MIIFNREKYLSAHGSLTDAQAQEIDFICREFKTFGLMKDYRHLAYILATVKHETANTFLPIEEYGKGKGQSYGQEVNGHRYYGRGYVQLTWLTNYRKMTARLNQLGIDCDLENNPEQALDTKIALWIMFVGMHEGIFTGKKLSDYINEHDEDSISARKVINGKDKAKMISEYYRKFKQSLEVI